MYPVHRRSLAYINAAVSSSSKFEQSDGIDGILVDREGVECEKLHALLGQLESRNCYEGDDMLRVRHLWSQLAMALCCLFLLLPLESCEFFFFLKATSIKPWTVLELGSSSQKLRTFRRNLHGADNETLSRWRFSKT